MNTVAFLTSAHLPLDDRIFYHQAISLSKKFKTSVIASTETFRSDRDGVTVISEDGSGWRKREKVRFFIENLELIKPQLVICSEPLPILAAAKYRRNSPTKVSILYDVTEWYPSKKHLEKLPVISKVLIFFKLLILNLYASTLCSGFIFGEYYKSLPYRLLFPFKKWKITGYYPDLRYIEFVERLLNPDKICLGYTGKISSEKGIVNFFDAARALKMKKPEVGVRLKIIGWCYNTSDKEIFERLCNESRDLDIEVLDRQDYTAFSDQLVDIDVLFDLRKMDFENNHCLPIKLFYYAACGRPVIYSNLRAIRREINVAEFGYLVNPQAPDEIADRIAKYLENTDLYAKHSKNGRMLAETKYHWQLIEPGFIDFVSSFCS